MLELSLNHYSSKLIRKCGSFHNFYNASHKITNYLRLFHYLSVLREVETFGIRYKRGSEQYDTAMKESLKKFLPQAQKAHKVQ